jgi:geranylgeranyl pyrophosphate synthase
MREYTNGHTPDLQAALDRVVSFGGKRVRPTVVLLTAGMFGADEEWGYFFLVCDHLYQGLGRL